ncbi:hypothetical protein [Scytonema sp. HK-05]|uniref:hypothetical protein n=1 Tax=Scytonema sp. HK-05 TaxID=1137095 RepID=UPI00093740BB|nr:hypothetical protein [Scytonema sp. HK-05]OKH58856.1 hypothetical protein NIES2130_12225 [Scytonema sp. HK-05]
MPFQKENKYRISPREKVPLDKNPLQLKLRQGILERIKAMPGWQSLLREKIEQWLEEWERTVQK